MSTAVYGILTWLIIRQITHAMAPGLLHIQHGILGGRNTTTLDAKLMNDLHKTKAKAHTALLDVGKGFPSVPRTMITEIRAVQCYNCPTRRCGSGHHM